LINSLLCDTAVFSSCISARVCAKSVGGIAGSVTCTTFREIVLHDFHSIFD